ncbi:MAG: tubulin-like doman-containing protein [Candidatus Bathyarchaeia archaeon]
MASTAKNYSLHLVGLGGAGSNILEAFFKSSKIFQFLQLRGVKLTCLALDVADHDILRLIQAYEEFKEELRVRHIPADKAYLNARSVKFPTPQAMFEYIQKLPEYIKLEGGNPPENYKPWLSSAVEIPPLSGGVARRRALAKAIYGLNYHYLRLLDSYIENFKENVSSSILQPLIFVFFGVGGGSGSGMVMDFVRHLRKKIGTGFPIIGVGILPCQGDDHRAKGASAYAAINELELLIEGGKNKIIRETYGETYGNPFTAFLMMPLAPPYKKTGNLLEAQRFFDEAVVDIVLNTMKFDMADMLDGIGANLDYGENAIHIMTTLRVTYPILEHIALAKLYLEKLSKLKVLRRERMEILAGSEEKGFGGLEQLINLCYAELAEIFWRLQRSRGAYDPAKKDESIRGFIYSDKSVESNYRIQIRGLEEAIRDSVDEIVTPVLAIGLEAPEATPEARLRTHISQIIDHTRHVASTYLTFHEDISNLINELNSNVTATQRLTFRERTQLNDFLEFVKFIEKYISVLKRYVETKVLADKLVTELRTGEAAEWKDQLGNIAEKIANVELKLIFNTLTGLFRSGKAEISTIESYSKEVSSLTKTLREDLSQTATLRDQLAAEIKNSEEEIETSLKEAERFSVRVFRPSKGKKLKEKAASLQKEVEDKKTSLQEVATYISSVEGRVKEYTIIERRVDIDSDYRRLLMNIVDIDNQYYEKLSEVSRDRGYYDRVMDITEGEKLRIMSKILQEEEYALTRENILKEIIDLKRFRECLIGAIRVLQVPSSIGVESSYKSDYMWVTVVAPEGIWDPELDAELKATLAGYLSTGAARSIHVSHVEAEDPWTIRILLVAGKASKKDLDLYLEMKSLYEQASYSDKILAHSLLLEHGILAAEAPVYIPQQRLASKPVGTPSISVCPNCKSTNTSMLKEWNMSTKSGKGLPLHVALYNCSECNKKFRVVTKV